MRVVADLLSEELGRIDRLAEANRRNRSAETDELLIKARRDGASLVLSSRCRGDIPEPPSEDPFAGTTGLPEIDAAQLTAAHLASALLLHGALLVRALVGAVHLDILTRLLDKKDVTQTAGDGDREASDRREIASTMRKGLPTMRCTPDACHDIIEMYKDVGVGETISEYLGERPLLVAERLRLGRQRQGAGIAWHQDGAFYGAFGAVGVWLAITPSGDDAPALTLIPRRFNDLFEVGPEESYPLPLAYIDRLTPDLIREFRGDYPISSPTFGAGDALFLDEMTLHRTSECEWKRPHKDVALTWFFAPSRFPVGFTPLIF